jgi:integrase
MRLRNDVSISRFKARKCWLVRWHGKYDPTKDKQKRFSKSFKRKKDAEKYAQSLKNDINDGINIEPKNINLGNLTDRFINFKKSTMTPGTVRAYQETVNRLINTFGAHRNVKTITAHEAQSFIGDMSLLTLDKDPADSTKAKHLRGANAVFNQAVEWGYLRKNPFKGISITNITKEEWRYVNPAEFQALLTAIDNIKPRKSIIQQDQVRKVRLKAFYSIMYGCGLRFGEAIHLHWDKNIDFINSMIHIKNRKSQNGCPPFGIKTHQDRSIPAPKWVMDYLRELKDLSKMNNPYVLVNDDRFEYIKKKWADWKEAGKEDSWLNSTMVNNTNRDFVVNCRRAGIITSDKLSVHSLRKSYGTNLAGLGTPVHTLRSLMGHSNIQTTMKFYVKNTDENSLKAVRGLEGLMNSEG